MLIGLARAAIFPCMETSFRPKSHTPATMSSCISSKRFASSQCTTSSYSISRVTFILASVRRKKFSPFLSLRFPLLPWNNSRYIAQLVHGETRRPSCRQWAIMQAYHTASLVPLNPAMLLAVTQTIGAVDAGKLFLASHKLLASEQSIYPVVCVRILPLHNASQTPVSVLSASWLEAFTAWLADWRGMYAAI